MNNLADRVISMFAHFAGIDTLAEAKGYFIVKGKTPVKEGDQLIFGNHTFSIIDVRDDWIWNKLANIIIAVK